MDIVVFQPDRIARDITVWLDFVAICEDYNRTIHEVSVGEINTKTAVGQMTSKMRIVFAEFEKNMFKERSRAGALRNMREGRYIFRPPLGYKTIGTKKTSRIVKDEAVSKILKDILLDYCDEKITVPDAVMIMKKHGVKTSKTAMHRIVNNIFYAGYYEYPEWGLGLTKGNHEALVPLSVIQKIKERNTVRTPISKIEDFPLKSVMFCIDCKRQIRTSKFKKGKFAYHYCKNDACSMKHKYISPEVLDEAIIANLKTIRIGKNFKQVILHTLKIMLDDKTKIQEEKQEVIKQGIKNNENRLRLTLMKIDKVDQPELVEKYQIEYNEIKKNIKGLEQELSLTPLVTVESFKKQVETLVEMLENPDTIYKNGDIKGKLSIVKLAYNNQISYDPNIKRLNLIYSPLIQEITSKNTPKGNLEASTGVEPIYKVLQTSA